jgi:predicted membrane chloride channel (bestrophin family)
MNTELKIKKRAQKKRQEDGGNINKEQSKFFVDVSKDQALLESIMTIIREANNRDYGRKITFKDLAIYALPKLTVKDLEKIQESTLNDMERVQKLLDEHNQKNSTTLSMGEFLVKKMNILKEAKDGK